MNIVDEKCAFPFHEIMCKLMMVRPGELSNIYQIGRLGVNELFRHAVINYAEVTLRYVNLC